MNTLGPYSAYDLKDRFGNRCVVEVYLGDESQVPWASITVLTPSVAAQIAAITTSAAGTEAEDETRARIAAIKAEWNYREPMSDAAIKAIKRVELERQEHHLNGRPYSADYSAHVQTVTKRLEEMAVNSISHPNYVFG